jgi:hypothetical protein
MDADDLTADGMSTGVQQSDIYLLFLSDGVLGRPFVHLELRAAIQANKQIITLYESDERHGKFDFAEAATQCPDDLRFIMKDIEAIPYRRRKYGTPAFMYLCVITSDYHTVSI